MLVNGVIGQKKKLELAIKSAGTLHVNDTRRKTTLRRKGKQLTNMDVRWRKAANIKLLENIEQKGNCLSIFAPENKAIR